MHATAGTRAPTPTPSADAHVDCSVRSQVIISKRAGRLGVSCIDANPAGAIVSSLIDGSVAAAAGLHVGDIITTVNGNLIDGHRDCIQAIDSAADRVAFVLARPTRSVRLDKRRGRVGLTCRTEPCGHGVQVAALEPGSVALAAGLFVGDVLLSINGVLVSDHRHAIELIDAAHVLSVVVDARTREVTLDKRSSNRDVGLTVSDRIDGGSGVVVTGLQPGGLAIQRLALGDTILSIEGCLVEGHADAITRVDQADATFRLVIGERCDGADLQAVLTSLHASSAAPFLRQPHRQPHHGYGGAEQPCEPPEPSYRAPYGPLSENRRRSSHSVANDL